MARRRDLALLLLPPPKTNLRLEFPSKLCQWAQLELFISWWMGPNNPERRECGQRLQKPAPILNPSPNSFLTSFKSKVTANWGDITVHASVPEKYWGLVFGFSSSELCKKYLFCSLLHIFKGQRLEYKVPLLSKIHLLISNELYVYIWRVFTFKNNKVPTVTVLTDEAFYLLLPGNPFLSRTVSALTFVLQICLIGDVLREDQYESASASLQTAEN